MKNIISRIVPRNFLPAIVWGLIITSLSITPGEELPKVDIWSFDKFAHIGVFLLWVWLILRGFLQSHDIGTKIFFKKCSLVFLMTVSYGIILEFVQGGYISNRYFDLFDIIANTIGCGLGILAYRLFDHKTY